MCRYFIGCLIFFLSLHIAFIDGYVSKCVKSGMKCSDCENLKHCVSAGNGKYLITHDLNFCNNSLGQYCSVKEGGCSSDPASCRMFGLQEIPCKNASTFPDPYDCTTYHQCVQQNDGSFISLKYNCPDDRAFDPLSSTCRFKPSHRVCRDSPVPKCIFALQNGPLVQNPAIYYVCVNSSTGNKDLQPLLFRCRTGEEYKSNSCVETTDSIKNFSCIGFGEGNFIDPLNSSNFYKCNPDNTFTYEQCGDGEYFAIQVSRCQKIPMYGEWV